MRLSLSGLIVLASGTALAQPVPGPMLDGTSNYVQSVLPNLLSTAPGGTVDARMDFTLDGEDDDNSLTLFAVNLHGQFISPGGLGGYVALPFFYASANGESRNGIGNLEVGGLYAVRQGIDTDILLRGGIALDTASDEDILFLVAAQLSPKLLDLYTSGFDTTWGRAQASVRHAAGDIRIGGAVGFDLPIDGLAADAAGFDGAITAAGSVGFQGPSVGLGVGFAMVKVLTDADTDDDTFTSINATIDFPVGEKMRFFGAFGYPEPDDNDFDVFSIGAGIRAGM
jgi:hypothetical protein